MKDSLDTVLSTRRGIGLMIAAMVVFAAQDGVSKHLATHYSPVFVTMIRYWFFAMFVIALSARRAGGLRRVVQTRHPALQIMRGALLAFEIVVMITVYRGTVLRQRFAPVTPPV